MPPRLLKRLGHLEPICVGGMHLISETIYCGVARQTTNRCSERTKWIIKQLLVRWAWQRIDLARLWPLETTI